MNQLHNPGRPPDAAPLLGMATLEIARFFGPPTWLELRKMGMERWIRVMDGGHSCWVMLMKLCLKMLKDG